MKPGKCFWWVKHKIINTVSDGYRCSRCGKPKSQCMVKEDATNGK